MRMALTESHFWLSMSFGTGSSWRRASCNSLTSGAANAGAPYRSIEAKGTEETRISRLRFEESSVTSPADAALTADFMDLGGETGNEKHDSVKANTEIRRRTAVLMFVMLNTVQNV